jgi:hypothetical protein
MGAFLLLSTDLRIGVDRVRAHPDQRGEDRADLAALRDRGVPAAAVAGALQPRRPHRRAVFRQQAVVAGFLDEVCPSESLALTAVERAKGALDAAPRVVPRDQVCACAARRSTPSASRSTAMWPSGTSGFLPDRLSRFKVVGVWAWNRRAARFGAARDSASRSLDVRCERLGSG